MSARFSVWTVRGPNSAFAVRKYGDELSQADAEKLCDDLADAGVRFVALYYPSGARELWPYCTAKLASWPPCGRGDVRDDGMCPEHSPAPEVVQESLPLAGVS